MKKTTIKSQYCSRCGSQVNYPQNNCENCGRKIFPLKKTIIITIIIISLVFISCGGYFLYEKFSTNNFSAEEIYKLSSPATVEISIETEHENITGSGFFFDNEGTIITNFHVIENATSGYVYLNNGAKYKILRLIGFDQYFDVAIIQIDYQSPSFFEKRIKPIQTGETVYALGSPLGLTNSFSEGIVSSDARLINGNTFIQTTAPISHGNSGGPLIDKNGKVVGITAAGIDEGQNLNLAIPIDIIDKIDQTKPVNFPGNLSFSEYTEIHTSGFTYWEWLETRK